jgi:hypothetical protein
MKVTLQTAKSAAVYYGDSVKLDSDQLALFVRGQERRRVTLNSQTYVTIENETAAHIPQVWPTALHFLPWLLIAGIALGLDIDYHAAFQVPAYRWLAFHGILFVAILLCMALVRFLANRFDAKANLTTEGSR